MQAGGVASDGLRLEPSRCVHPCGPRRYEVSAREGETLALQLRLTAAGGSTTALCIAAALECIAAAGVRNGDADSGDDGDASVEELPAGTSPWRRALIDVENGMGTLHLTVGRGAPWFAAKAGASGAGGDKDGATVHRLLIRPIAEELRRAKPISVTLLIRRGNYPIALQPLATGSKHAAGTSAGASTSSAPAPAPPRMEFTLPADAADQLPILPRLSAELVSADGKKMRRQDLASVTATLEMLDASAGGWRAVGRQEPKMDPCGGKDARVAVFELAAGRLNLPTAAGTYRVMATYKGAESGLGPFSWLLCMHCDLLCFASCSFCAPPFSRLLQV